MTRLSRLPVLAAAGLLAACSAYLLGLLAAAFRGRRKPGPPPPPGGAWPHLLVLVPAHDEAAGIAETLRALQRAPYPGDLDVTVIADNCTDATGEAARAEGATVLERHDPQQRGKGQALAWALERLEHEAWDAVLFLDADCLVSEDLPRAVGARLAAGAEAVQVDYVVSNPGESPTAGLRYAGFALINTVRPLGKSTRGLSAGLLGTGMALSRPLLDRVPWDAFGLAEDLEYHLRLIDSGETVQFAPEAAVHSEMPADDGGSAAQQSRWEAGRLDLARRWAPALVRSGARARDPVRVHGGLELLVPSQSALLAAHAGVLAAAAVTGSRGSRRVALASLFGQAGAILGALHFVGAPRSAYRSLLLAPGLVARKLMLYRSIATGRGPAGWERTAREPVQRV